MGRTLLIGLLAVALLLVGVAAAGSGPQATNAQEDRVENLVADICTPVTNTHPDGTATATVAAGVDPSESLVAIWQNLAAEARWLGYSPDVPVELNDLQTVDRLDVIFVCTTADGTITMPPI